MDGLIGLDDFSSSSFFFFEKRTRADLDQQQLVDQLVHHEEQSRRPAKGFASQLSVDACVSVFSHSPANERPQPLRSGWVVVDA